MGFDHAAHENIYIQILRDIYSDTSLSPLLGFKGGTAAYLFYGLARFSVDLDFDLLEESKEDYVFEKVGKIVGKYGKIKEARKKRFNLFFLLSYQERVQNIKVEINRRSLGSKYEVKNHLGISMLVMTKEDMFANKIMAMQERLGRSNRDIFDVWFFLKNNWPMNKDIVEKRAGVAFLEFLEKCINSLERLGDQFILGGMGELLDAKQKVWAKANLRKDTIFLLRLKLKLEEGKK